MNKPKCPTCNKSLYRVYIRAKYQPFKAVEEFYYCVDCEQIYNFKMVEK